MIASIVNTSKETTAGDTWKCVVQVRKQNHCTCQPAHQMTWSMICTSAMSSSATTRSTDVSDRPCPSLRSPRSLRCWSSGIARDAAAQHWSWGPPRGPWGFMGPYESKDWCLRWLEIWWIIKYASFISKNSSFLEMLLNILVIGGFIFCQDNPATSLWMMENGLFADDLPWFISEKMLFFFFSMVRVVRRGHDHL